MLPFHITGYSTALFATWYFVEEARLLLDAGDGVTSALLQKSRKIDHVFISHADRDHLTGLAQLNQLNARPGYPVVHYPEHSASFPALETFSKAFDHQVGRTVWTPLGHGSEVRIRKDLLVQALVNGHVPVAAGIVKSLSYKVIRTADKLDPAIAAMPEEEIIRIIRERGRASVTQEERATLLGYSGDTPVGDMDRWQDTDVLIHEATFLGGSEAIPQRTHGNLHSRLDEVLEAVSGLRIGTLILGHFSSRYDAATIDRQILALCNRYAIGIPVHRVLPGEIRTDILQSPPLNS